MTVLVVDDEEDAQSLMRQMFRREIRKGTLAFEFATSAREALTLMEGIDDAGLLVLTDVNMPEMTGLELLAKVRAHNASLPIIMVTAYGDAEIRRRAEDLGANAFVQKPIDFTELRRLVADMHGTG